MIHNLETELSSLDMNTRNTEVRVVYHGKLFPMKIYIYSERECTLV